MEQAETKGAGTARDGRVFSQPPVSQLASNQAVRPEENIRPTHQHSSPMFQMQDQFAATFQNINKQTNKQAKKATTCTGFCEPRPRVPLNLLNALALYHSAYHTMGAFQGQSQRKPTKGPLFQRLFK